jgi:translocation and assembly module TamB
MRRRRLLWIGAWMVAVLLAGAGITGLLVVRSRWFYDRFRERIVATVENATGGRVEIGGFQVDWKHLRAEVSSLVIHGREPGDKPPLFRASTIAVGLKIVSLWKRDVDIQSLDIAGPHVFLIVNPDGSTNIPEPKVKSSGNTVETILNLAIGRFSLAEGIFEIDSRGATPFDARGQNLAARFGYDRAGPRYRGTIAIDPLDLRLENRAAIPFRVRVDADVEKNRVVLTTAQVATGGTSVAFSGAIEDLASPRGSFAYDAHVSLTDVSRIFHVPELQRGEVELGGNAVWAGGARLSATGNLRASGVAYRDSVLALRNWRLDGAVTAGADGIDVRGVRIGGTYYTSIGEVPVEGGIQDIALRRQMLDLHAVYLAALGGTFRGEGRLRDWVHYTIGGDIQDFAARRVVGLYSRAPLPWDGAASGPVHLEGSLRNGSEFRVTLQAAVSPVAGSAPVHGQITANYEARTATVDVGRSTLDLPSSRAQFSGAYGREMEAHLETRDLNDLLPLLGGDAASLPVKLDNGHATFDGMVSGKLDEPHFAGRLSASGFTVEGRRVDALTADATASPENVHLRNAIASRGGVRASFDAAVALRDWKFEDDSTIFGSVTTANAPMPDLLAILDRRDEDLAGTVAGTIEFRGTVGNPLAKGNVEVTRGSFRGEPFDRLTAQVSYSGNTAEVASAQLSAGSRQIQFSGSYEHAAGDLTTGTLKGQVSSNAMALDRFVVLEKLRPGIKGVVTVSASGQVGIGRDVKLEALQGEVSGTGLQLTGQQLGNARLQVRSADQVLRAHLDADVANSAIRGDATVKLVQDYSTDAALSFSKLDFAQLRAWISPGAKSAAERFTGFAEGEMHATGPAFKPAQWKAEVRLPRLEIGPVPGAGLPEGLTLRNAGPIQASIAGSAVTLDRMRLTGRVTDVTVGGKVLLDQKAPLDIRVSGRIDPAVVREFNPDLIASGTVTADAGVRGTLDAPQINGRVQFQDAAFNIVDFPNGISKANGEILFSGDRATIQSFTGETGGGKVQLTGFATYDGTRAAFQLHGRAEQVRVRYPEGVSTVADADLRLTGGLERSTLAGTITVRRTGFNPQTDFSSVIATSAEPVKTPAARTGVLGGITFDVQVETAPDIQFQSSLTQDLQVDANLRLRGTLSNPALIGRININQGQVVFYGTRYTINQGSVSFYNPLKIDPILDIDLETKARGIDITLTISGPLNKLNLTPRSDPPLQFNEIVALLATGRTPTSDPTLLAQQSTAPQSWQQMGASALLGQAIANPVAGRLQRFFGVSRLRIDPTLPGVETNNPQARVTVEQQVTPEITFTYITNVTSSNPQVVRVEWSVSKQWSMVLLREENGAFGLDFFYKKQF